MPLYKEMLHATSVSDVEDTAKIAGIDLTDKAFWRQGLQSLADEIDLFCDLSSKKTNVSRKTSGPAGGFVLHRGIHAPRFTHISRNPAG